MKPPRERTPRTASIHPAGRSRRYALTTLLAQSDPTSTEVDDLAVWDNMGCIGVERFWEDQRPLRVSLRKKLACKVKFPRSTLRRLA